jgi:O-antigen/teichoic acid export membrane protein
LLIPAWLLRGALARLTLGSDLERGSYYYALVLPMLWFSVVGELPSMYLRARKWSGIFLGVSVARLVLNIALNVYLLVVLRMGIAAVLVGNLITAAVATSSLLGFLVANIGRFSFHKPLAREILYFAAPLAVTGLTGLAMHNADRYLLRMYLDMDQVGIYSFAYTIGQGVNTLILAPFNAIWATALYEIAKEPGARDCHKVIFQWFVYAFTLIMLGVSLFARPILALVAAESYGRAADLVPVVCLAYVIFSLHSHFQVPALLAKRTVSLLPAAIFAASLNIGLNLLLIPRWGTAAAAWVSVVTFSAYSFIGLALYRRIDRYDYPLLRCGAVLAAMAATFMGCRSLGHPEWARPWTLLVPALAWVIWATYLFGSVAATYILSPATLRSQRGRSDVILSCEGEQS